MDKAVELIRRQEELANGRSNFNMSCQEINEIILPEPELFNNRNEIIAKYNKNLKNTQSQFTGIPNLAVLAYGALAMSNLTPPGQKWHGLASGIEDLDSQDSIKTYYDIVVNRMFSARNEPSVNFIGQIGMSYYSLAKYGNACLYIENTGKGFWHKNIHISELYFTDNYQGLIDTIYRRFSLTARQIAQHFGVEKLSSKMKYELDKDSTETFSILHAVFPNENYDPWLPRLTKHMKYYSCWISIDDKQILAEGGYRTQPYCIGRHMVQVGDVYGTGPAAITLPDLKSLNAISKAKLMVTKLLANPPLLTGDEVESYKLMPGGILKGGINYDGKPMVIPVQLPNANELLRVEAQELIANINEAFGVDIIKTMTENTSVTPSPFEIAQRKQIESLKMTPTLGRLQTEFINPIIIRQFDIMNEDGMLPPMPDELKAMFHGDVFHKIEYLSPLAMAQRAQDGANVTQFMGNIDQLAQAFPTVLQQIDSDALTQYLADIYRIPPKLLRSPEQVAALQQQQMQQQQLAQVLQAAPQATAAAKNLQEMQAQAQQAQPANYGAMA